VITWLAVSTNAKEAIRETNISKIDAAVENGHGVGRRPIHLYGFGEAGLVNTPEPNLKKDPTRPIHTN